MTSRNCRQGQHGFAEQDMVGAGINRRSCRWCGAVEIDLSESLQVGEGSGLFKSRSDSFFILESKLVAVFANEEKNRTFGRPRAGRRRAAPGHAT